MKYINKRQLFDIAEAITSNLLIFVTGSQVQYILTSEDASWKCVSESIAEVCAADQSFPDRLGLQ